MFPCEYLVLYEIFCTLILLMFPLLFCIYNISISILGEGSLLCGFYFLPSLFFSSVACFSSFESRVLRQRMMLTVQILTPPQAIQMCFLATSI